jgi:predicted transcriptional regulator
MQLTIQLDPETARQLAAIQKQTNQDHIAVIQQSIGLYHQQVQPHCLSQMEMLQTSNLSGITSAISSSVN